MIGRLDTSCSMTSDQNLNAKSSTEVDVVGTAEYSPKVLRTMLFLEMQGVVVIQNMILQDNQAAMSMEMNGKNPVVNDRDI